MSEEIKNIEDFADQFGKAFEEFKQTNNERLDAVEAKGSADVLTEEKLDRINEQLTKFEKHNDELVLQAKRRERTVLDAQGNEIDLDKKAQDFANSIVAGRNKLAPEMDAKGLAEYKANFNKYLRNDEKAMSHDELKALSVGTDADGGYRVHPDLSGAVISEVRQYSNFRAYANIRTISTNELEGIHNIGGAVSGWVAETAARPETDTPTMARWSIPVYELYANPASSQQMLDDADFNVEAWLSEEVGISFAQKEGAAFTSGSGSGEPTGILTYPSGTTWPTQIQQFNTSVSGGFAATPDGADSLIDAVYAMKAAHRSNSTWFMNSLTAGEVRKLKNSDGSYLWQQSVAAGQPSTLLGYPTAAFEDMPDIAADSLSMMFADMRKAYTIVDRTGIRVLRDPYTNKPFVNFYTTKRVGGDVTNVEAVKIIAFSA